jgi:ATP-dependent DNA helicase RecQ
VVFHDATLLEMVKTRPNSLPDLLELGGVGQAKLEKYGEAFLACLAEEV